MKSPKSDPVPVELLLAWAWYYLASTLFLHTLGLSGPSQGPPGAHWQLRGCMACCAHGRMGGASNNTMHMTLVMVLGPSGWPSGCGPASIHYGECVCKVGALGGACCPCRSRFGDPVGVRCFDGEPHASTGCASRQQPSHVAKVEKGRSNV
jgi:hypothetical protein